MSGKTKGKTKGVLMTLPLTSIPRGMQSARWSDHAKIDEMKAALIRGESFPAISVRFDGTHHWLQDGHLRYEATLAVCGDVILCEVFPGGRRCDDDDQHDGVKSPVMTPSCPAGSTTPSPVA